MSYLAALLWAAGIAVILGGAWLLRRRLARDSCSVGEPSPCAAGLAEVCRVLWPEPAYTSYAGADPTRSLIVLPGIRRPRLIVPLSRRAAAAAVRQYGEPGSRRARVAGHGLSLLLRSGVGGVVFRDRLHVHVPAGATTIESYLQQRLGLELRVSTHLRSPRANRKPVLHLLTPDGSTVGFAKIGVTPLTRRLMRVEQEALTRLGDVPLANLTVPTVLHAGDWVGRPVLVLSPLPTEQRRTALTSERRTSAMVEVARVAGVRRGSLATGRYWLDLTGRLAALDGGADLSALISALGDVADCHRETPLSCGAWHGDWTPWNQASTSSGLLVWDWERFSVGAPVGFDALHYWLWTQVVSGGRDRRLAAADCVTQAPLLLRQFEVGADEAALTAVLYLAELATRALVDRQATSGNHPVAPGRWLIPAITEWAGNL